MSTIDLTGRQFGRLTVIEFAGRNKHGHVVWHCQCVCGNTKAIPTSSLMSGCSKSCGCFRREIGVLRMAQRGKDFPGFKHGHGSKALGISPTYQSWRGMHDRCANPNLEHYRNVGISPRWCGEDGFENFLSDMGERPEGTSLSRYLDMGNYEPGNCEWGTLAQQAAEQYGKKAMLRVRAYNQKKAA